MTNISLQTLETVKARLCERRRTLGNWEAVAAEFGVSLGTAVRVANGYEPKNAALRSKLGLPGLALAPVCACGEVHTRKGRCPNAPKLPRKPRTDWKARALMAEQDVMAFNG